MIIKPALEQLVRDVVTVVSLPAIYTLLDEAINEDAPNKEIAKIISDDAGVTSRLLRIANSPFYGFASKVDTISRAVTIIGTRQLTQLVLAITVIELFEDKVNGKFDLLTFWRHSIACATVSRVLASYLEEANIERFFVSGLLHDIGKLVFMMVVPELGIKLMDMAKQEDRFIHDVEREYLGYDHADVGAELLRQWKLPSPLITSVNYHHSPMKAQTSKIDAAVVHTAEVVSNAIQIVEGTDGIVPTLEPRAWEMLGLSETILSPLCDQVRLQFKQAMELIMSENNK